MAERQNRFFTKRDNVFHQFTGDGDNHNDLAMNRDGKVFTVSITGVEIADQKAMMTYLDLLNNKKVSSGY
ncbi:MAG: hypothetical protein WDO19_18800 [Bacteroidota bacterium]